MSDLTEFLLARLAEDEARWMRNPYSLAPSHRDSYEAPHWPDCDYPGDMTGVCTCPMLARVLAEVEAKRQIVEWCSLAAEKGMPVDAWTIAKGILRNLASVYADHPDYDEAWRA